MRHQNSVLQQVLQYVPWNRFEELVEEFGADKGVRRLSTRDQLIALLCGQLMGSSSLRAIEGSLLSHSRQLYHVGSRTIRRSTLGDANQKRPSGVFSGLLTTMIAMMHRKLRRDLAETTYLIDATGVRLNERSAHWARFTTAVCGAKLHVIYDADADQPIYAAVSAANVNDIVPAQSMPIEAGATYVFDLGYYDFAWWAKLDEAGCRIVTRLKKNTRLNVIKELKVEGDDNILSDRIGLLPTRLCHTRSHPFQEPLREVRVRIDSGKILRIVTNDLDAAAQQIADLYKRRWAIELFFRWIKQVLQLGHFVGLSENAVRIQLCVALIAFMLLRLAYQAQKSVAGPLAFARLVRSNLMHRRPIDRLLQPDEYLPSNPRQIELKWA